MSERETENENKLLELKLKNRFGRVTGNRSIIYFYFGLIEKYIGSRLDLENLDFEFAFFPDFA